MQVSATSYYEVSMSESKKAFNSRGFISISLTLAFIILAVSGLVLYIMPSGRVAFWINWKLLGLTKEDWGAVHTIFSSIFVVLSVIHIVLNWRVLMSHIRSKVESGIKLRKELAIAAACTILIFSGILFGLPPFSTVMNVGESIKDSWEEGATPAPAPHTELKTVAEVANDFGMQIDRVLDKLKRNGITNAEEGITLKELGLINNMAPSDIYEIIARRGGGDGGNSNH